MILFEQSALLRTLNYVRIRHGFACRYNWVYPAVFATVSVILLYYFDLLNEVFVEDGILSELGPYFSLTAPFFLAALSAVATFAGPPGFDDRFKMVKPVTLLISDKGQPKIVNVTPRYFLSLLFGYCCVLSFFLFVISVLLPYADVNYIGSLNNKLAFIWVAVAWVYFFFAFQVTVLMLLGIYYLADKFHRSNL